MEQRPDAGFSLRCEASISEQGEGDYILLQIKEPGPKDGFPESCSFVVFNVLCVWTIHIPKFTLGCSGRKSLSVLVQGSVFPVEVSGQKITCPRPQGQYHFHVSGLAA